MTEITREQFIDMMCMAENIWLANDDNKPAFFRGRVKHVTLVDEDAELWFSAGQKLELGKDDTYFQDEDTDMVINKYPGGVAGIKYILS